MAEYVNQRLEEMIPELEEMSSIGLFSIKETKVILKLREAHEYKLRQQTKTKQSFLNYIEYEKKLLELIKIRRKKLGQDSKKRDVEKAIADRIHKLYRLVCERFSDDLHLWEQHIEFTKLMNEKSYVSRLYTKVLKIHSHNEDLWVKSARWESSKEGNMNPDLAREILLKAQRVNPESQLIFLEMFRMELDLAKIAVKRKQILGLADKKDDTSDDDCSQINIGQELKIANIIYSKGIEIFPGNSELHLKMLAVCCAVKEAKALRQQIVQDLQCLYPENPQVWHALALINLNGLRKMDKANQRESAKQCVEVYQQAVEKLPNEKMYSLCLSALLTLLKTREFQGADWLRKTSISLFEKGIQHGVLSETMYNELLEILEGSGLNENVLQVSKQATSDHPGSCKLWLTRLRLMVTVGQADSSAVEALLKTSLKHIPSDEAWPVWEFVLTYHGSRGSAQFDQLLEEACRNVSSSVSLKAKDWSLQWIYRHEGIKKAREFFSRFKSLRPVSLSFFKLYVQMENSQMSPNVDLIRNAMEECLVTFGHKEPDLWLNYLHWETHSGKDSGKSGDIYQRALTALDPEQKDAFIRKHVLSGLVL